MEKKSFVDLTLTDETGKNSFSIFDVVSIPGMSIILGAPGSGKSRILEEINSNNEKACYVSVEDFLMNDLFDESFEILLLDGFDEYRNSNTGKSKNTIVKELAVKLSTIVEKNKKVIVACREMDWRGNADGEALSRYLKVAANIFVVSPLSEEQKRRFKDVYEMSDEAYSICNANGFLENPQLFLMSKKISKNLTAQKFEKKQLYERFVECCQEQNENNIGNGVNVVESDAFKKNAAYIASYYIFADDFELNEISLRSIADAENGFTIDRLLYVLKSSLIIKNKFCHRTVAEFLAAKSLAERLNKGLSLSRLKSLISSKNIVFSEYRGVFSWLCSFTENSELIKMDPYLQYQYGDNSFFSSYQKEMVIKAVESYSKEDPLFYRKGLTIASKSFYSSKLDDLLIDSYRKNISNPSHFLFFLSDLLVLGQSEKIKELAKDVLENKTLEDYYKKPFISVLKDEKRYLRTVFDKISSQTLKDEDNELRVKILSILYPDYVTEQEIVSYLHKFNKEEYFGGHGRFLEKTRKEYLWPLTKQILSDKWINHDSYSGYPEYVDKLIAFGFNNHFFESSPSTFWTDIAFLCDDHKMIFDYVHDVWYRYFKNEIKIDGNRSFELFKSFILFTQNNDVWHYGYYFSFVLDHLLLNLDDIINAIEGAIGLWNTEDQIKCILWARNYWGKDSALRKDADIRFFQLAETFNLGQRYRNDTQPSDSSLKLAEKYKRRHQKQIEDQEKQIKKNEEWLAQFPITTWKNKPNLLTNIALKVLFHESFDKIEPASIGFQWETTEKIISVIKSILFESSEKRISNELLNEDSLSESMGRLRTIDDLYYVSLTLNEIKNFDKIKDATFERYLYLVACHNYHVGNIRKSLYTEWFESRNLEESKDVLLSFVEKVLMKAECPRLIINELRSIANNSNLPSFVKKMKNIMAYIRPEDFVNSFFEQIIRYFHIEISNECLLQIQKISNEKIYQYCTSLLILKEDSCLKIEKETLVILYDILPGNFDNLHITDLPEKIALRFIDNLMNCFNSEEKVKYHSGIQSIEDSCTTFIRHSFWNYLDGNSGIEFLNKLLDNHQNDYWTNRIKSRIVELKEDMNTVPVKKNISDIKTFLLGTGFISYEDFYEYCIEIIQNLKCTIQDERLGDKIPFYKDINSPRIENECRDEILRRLLDSHKEYLEIIPEGREGDNRVDMRVICRKNESYEVQVECKRDSNPEIKTGIEKQLVQKYFSTNVKFGIYLVFCFKKDPQKLTTLIMKTIPKGFENNVKIICIDLRRK